ncbi:hypothetical protein V6N13_073825 [Hibiscus sabdariffa]
MFKHDHILIHTEKKKGSEEHSFKFQSCSFTAYYRRPDLSPESIPPSFLFPGIFIPFGSSVTEKSARLVLVLVAASLGRRSKQSRDEEKNMRKSLF